MFHRIDVPTESPGQCKLCGSGDKPWYLDLNVKERMYGHVYYCSDCIADMLAVAQLDTEVAKRDATILAMTTTVNELTATIAERDNALRFIARTKFFASVSTTDPNPQDVGNVAGASEVAARSDSQHGEFVSLSGTESDESSSIEGLADVPSSGRKSGRKSHLAVEF